MSMWPRLQSMLIFFLLMVLYLGVIYLVQNHIPSARLDLTENKLFTLSQGSERIIKNIKTPIELNLYYSEKEARPYPQFRQYAERVIEKIEEYAELSGKKILFKQIDPEPYSVAEDLAIANGILAVPLEDGSGPLYFGLTAKSGKMLQSIGFIKPESEQNLEYELSKLMQSVQVNTKRKVALVSELPIAGNANPSMGPVSSAWVIYRQLSERFDVQVLNPQGLEIPADIGVLWVVHPKNWPKSTLKQIQDYVESGRHAVFMLDPYAESVPAMSVFEQALGSGFSESDMPALLSRWGIGYDPSQVVLDSKYAWLMQLNENQFPKRNPALISLPSESMNQMDSVTSDLDRVVLSSAGALSILESSPLRIEPLLQSSDSSKLISVDKLYAASEDPEQLLNKFVSSQEPFVLAARFTGPLRPSSSPTQTANFIVIADTDFLSDRLWVIESNLFGQPVFSAQASNGDFFFNIIDQLSGSDDLISIRSRGMVSRPFDKVDQIRRAAEQEYRDNQVLLAANLEKVQAEISGMQVDGKIPSGQLNSPRFKALTAEKISLRQQLRRIQQELNKDVDRLGELIKLINIFSVPLVLLLLGLIIVVRHRMRKSFARVPHGSV